MALIGLTPPPAPPAPANNAADAPDVVFDVGMDAFEARVLKASMDTPILIDFWAPWCGPCKQLTPTLEGLVRENKGAILLAKVNIDENPELAQAFRVQSVPTVIAMFQGQPVTGFVGAQPAGEIRKIIDQLVKVAGSAKPDALDIPATLAAADTALGAGDVAGAQELYATVLAHDEMNVQAYVGLVRTMIAAGDMDQARELVDAASDAMRANAGFAAAQTAIDLATAGPANAELGAFLDRIARNPDDHAARIDLALALFAAGDKDAAIDALIESIKRDRAWEDGRAKTQLLQFFDAMGAGDPAVKSGRRKLSAILFS